MITKYKNEMIDLGYECHSYTGKDAKGEYYYSAEIKFDCTGIGQPLLEPIFLSNKVSEEDVIKMAYNRLLAQLYPMEK